ncbi:Armdomain-containing protein [Lentinula edodes]|uniref:Armdomain-containing protein n=1 Tax=Lentinula edodes TaxID=5353 RepID=A0A1Q3DVM5_LENED|nr:Armdomain-containing protein [Lentinula edodes]
MKQICDGLYKLGSSTCLKPLSLPDDGDLFIRPDSLEVETSPPNTNLIRARWNGQLVVVKRMALDVSEEVFEAASGMQYLHKNGLIHGNLHPANIFITNDGHVNISEYSMFAFQHTSRHPQAYQYLSPESLKGTSPRSRASDVYSFAMCALEIFTSVSPWGALSEKHIYHLVVLENSRPDRPDDHRITDDLWNIIDSAWHQEPRSRPTFDFIVRLWRASSSQADIPPHATTTSLSPVYPSRFSVASNYSGPPAYELEEAQTPMSAPPTLQQFSFHRVGSTSSRQEIPPAAHYYSWYSSTAGSRVDDETGGPSQPSPPNTAPAAVQQFPANVEPPSPLIRPPSPSYSWYSSLIPSTERSSGSSSSSRSVDTPITSPDSSPSARRSRTRKGGSTKRTYGVVLAAVDDSGSTSSFSNMTTIGEALPRVDSQGPRDSYTRRWELSQRPYNPGRQESFSDVVSIRTESSGSRSTKGRTTAVLLIGALQTELNSSRNAEAIDSYVAKIYHSASESYKEAHKLVTAGAVPALIHLLKTRAAEVEGLEIVLITLGTLAYDSISANMIYRTNTTLTLIELCKSTISNEISLLAAKCYWRHALADFLAAMDIIPFIVSHLRQSTESPRQNPDHICAGLYAAARMSRSIKLAKYLAKAGCVELIVHHLNTSTDPNVLHWSARAVGCLMRPNSSDMARILLEADVAKGLARLPTVLTSENLQALGSLGFTVQRFSCAEWSGKIRQTLVEAGVVDSLLAALRTAADEPCHDVHIELALAISLLGDVGGSAIRKEIVNAGGITILRSVANGNPEVAKACNMAITSVTGNIWSRNAASAKTAMAHNWNGGCPEYQPPCPLVLRLL